MEESGLTQYGKEILSSLKLMENEVEELKREGRKNSGLKLKSLKLMENKWKI